MTTHFFVLFSWLGSLVVVMKMIQVVREGDGPVMSAGSRPHLSPGVSYIVENKLLICNLVIQSTRKTQQERTRANQKRVTNPMECESIKNKSRKKGESRKPVRLVLLTLAQSYINPSVVLALNESWRSEIERCCTAMVILSPYSSTSERGSWKNMMAVFWSKSSWGFCAKFWFSSWLRHSMLYLMRWTKIIPICSALVRKSLWVDF